MWTLPLARLPRGLGALRHKGTTAAAAAAAADLGAPIKFSTSPAARSNPARSLGAGQENPANTRLWAIVAVGTALTGTIVYSCATQTVDLTAPIVPDVLLRGLDTAPPPPAAAS